MQSNTCRRHRLPQHEVPKAGNIPLGRYLCPESGELAHIGKYKKRKKLDFSWGRDVRSKDDKDVVTEAHIPESTSQKI